MSLPEVELDNVRFQGLVNDARERVARKCPDWTEVNVSDPGITLIELFAWMTDMLSYRINRLPEKLHVALLSLIGVKLLPALAARTELCFHLDGPTKDPVRIARGTEVATRRTSTQESVVFRTTEGFTIEPVRLKACVLRRGREKVDVGVSNGSAQPVDEQLFAFAKPPAPGDCLLLGFSEPLDRLLVRVEVECKEARWAGVDPSKPPLAWQVSAPARDAQAAADPGAWLDDPDAWLDVTEVDDSTKGFNLAKGTVELQLPARTGRRSIDTREEHFLYWLCCRVTRPSDRDSLPPQIIALTAAPVGATVPAEHCQLVTRESLGHSDGTPGETFTLRHPPVLGLVANERLEVRRPGKSYWVPWERRAAFAQSKKHDRHYLLDETTGEIQLGPAVRQHDGAYRQYGAVTAAHSELRFSQYRHGGGRVGNVAAETLTQLREPIPRVKAVTNVRPATGGADAETLAEAGKRTAIELRTSDRAVTREDFERLCVAAHNTVARARCVPAKNGEPTRVYILPYVEIPPEELRPKDLRADGELLAHVADYLDRRRLVGTSILVVPAELRVVAVVVHAVADRATNGEDLEQRIAQALSRYLNPLVGGTADSAREGSIEPDVQGAGQDEQVGWQFGRALTRGELYPIVRAVDGVKEIKDLRLFEEVPKKVAPIEGDLELVVPIGKDLELLEHEVVASGLHRVKVDVSGA